MTRKTLFTEYICSISRLHLRTIYDRVQKISFIFQNIVKNIF